MSAYYASHNDFDSNRGLEEIQEAAKDLMMDFVDEPNYCFVFNKLFGLLQIDNTPHDLTDSNHPFNKYANDEEDPEVLIQKLNSDLLAIYANRDPLYRTIIQSFFDPNGENRGFLEDFMWDYWNYVNKALNIHQ